MVDVGSMRADVVVMREEDMGVAAMEVVRITTKQKSETIQSIG